MMNFEGNLFIAIITIAFTGSGSTKISFRDKEKCGFACRNYEDLLG